MTASLARMTGDLTAPFDRGADTLELPLKPSGVGAEVVPYDFAEHQARFGAQPVPLYVLTAVTDVTAATTLTVGYEVPPVGGDEGSRTVKVTVPPTTLSGATFAVVLPPEDAGRAVLRTLRSEPAPAPGPLSEAWRLTALLGNLARLLWVAGAEADVLDRHAADIRRAVRSSERASGTTLDRIGYDLGVARFPARPYGQEDDTVALYHLDDGPGAPVRDIWPLYLGGGTGHPGTATPGVQAGAPGRFGTGMRFAATSAEISVPHATALSTGAAASLTVECFVKPDAVTGEGVLLSKHADPSDPTLPGWALSIGTFGRGIARNVRLRIADGTASRDLYADRSLPVARFTHVAAVVDRTARQARLLLDGETVSLSALTAAPGVLALEGALANTEPFRIGRSGTDPAKVFTGIVDEVRLSAAARSSFHPVLGESDASYRRRLRIFRRWVLPTRLGVQDTLNEVVGPVQVIGRPDRVADPFAVTDTEATLLQSAHLLTVLPVEVPAGSTLDDTGRTGLDEADVLGPPGEDESFAPALLVDATDPRADFDAPPPTPGPLRADPRLMRVATRRALRGLLDALAAAGVAGRLRVRAGFDPTGPADSGLRAVGRALVLTHSGLAPERLAAQAVRAGFAFVAHRPGRGVEPGQVYAAVRSADSLEIVAAPGGTATPENGFDLLTGQTLALRLEPAPPAGAEVRWSLVPCGQGRASVPGNVDRRDVLIKAERPGHLVAAAQVRDRGRAFSASRPLRIGLAELAAGSSIAATGRLDLPAPGALRADERVHPVYLVDAPGRYARPAGSGPQTRRVHPVLAARLAALAALLPPGDPELLSAWDPGAAGPAAAGRAVTLAPGTSTASLARLGALAHAAGFSRVSHDGTVLSLTQDSGPAAPVQGPATVEEGATATVQVARAAPRAVALAAGLVWTVNGGTGSVSALDPVGGTVIACVKVGLEPGAIAAAPDGTRVMVADTGDTTLTVITTADRKVTGQIALPAPPADVTHHPSAARAYVGLRSGTLVEVDPVARTVTRTLALGSSVVAVRCEPGGGRLWAATADGMLRAVALPTFTAAQTVTLPDAADVPRGLAVGADRAYVTVPGALHVVDLATASIQATFTDAGTAPTALALDPSGALLYVIDPGGGRVHLRRADGTAHTLPGLPASLALPGATAVTADAAHGYVASNTDVADTVGVLDAGDGALLASWPLGTGLGERLVWSSRVTGGAQARLTGTTRPRTTVLGLRAGPVQVRAVLRHADATPPYTFRVEPSEELLAMERAGDRFVIGKDQYDLAMNVLNHLCPIGVEIDTRAIRAHVLELQSGLLDPFPPYTYPDFRTRGPRPPRWTYGLDQ
ncbi:LamG-like jellyroll fold domain-containing protein [Streptosporangium sp. NPDC051023]|uniref:LamG-like jellyroll fold domain-containing protein n=1 Tax=Streptosporangium sp. NPDC051023 TaxID=3155410 RepID=UPI00344F9141